MTKPIRIAVVDDHAIFRIGLIDVLGSVADLSIVAEGETIVDSCHIATQVKPDLMLLDVKLRDGSGIAAVAEIKKRSPLTQVLMLTAFDNEDSIVAAFQAGAHGYVLKGATAADLISAIRAICNGKTYVETAFAATLLKIWSSPRAPNSG